MPRDLDPPKRKTTKPKTEKKPNASDVGTRGKF